MKTIAFNLTFIVPGPLTGPGYYAVQLFEHISRLVGDDDSLRLVAYIQPASLKHLSVPTRAFARCCPELGNRFSRVLYEQLVLPFVARRDRVDLLFSPAFVSPLWGAEHLVATVCDMYYRTIPEMISAPQRTYWSVMIPLTSRVCARILTISENSKLDIERFLPAARGKTVSVPLASRFRANPASGEPVASTPPFVLMVANLTHNKNPGVVVEAVAALNQQDRSIGLVHAGSDPYGLLEDSIARNDASDVVTTLGKVSDADLADLYRSCLAVVTPSIYEGFGMPAVEAQAMGAPLISSDRAALPEAGGDAALYFDPSRADQLAARIITVMDLDAVERAALIERSLQSAARFSWERTAQETLAIFDNLLGRGAGAASARAPKSLPSSDAIESRTASPLKHGAGTDKATLNFVE